ncbi:MAG: hypothetical protein DRR16_15505 [Candidatus Parabeggiatoa sp. nov. 3]|nr:MAG: hypothetical protein DRR00_32820 [Gammaproteobacteria bacterium]RKZ52977.1 MAG: hypothetical protein DRQ99_32100 [Gammaproteobacteria bacterium]RKZ84157.1 MAG: hypothetical protein DRR16_15505 [Gammaproteobacteria bacterium]
MAEITGAQYGRNVTTASLIRFRNVLNWLVAAIEAYGWSTFATEPPAQIAFAAWAIAMVFVRSYLSGVKSLAYKHGDLELANRASLALLVSIWITGVSIYTAYSNELEQAKQARIAASAPVRLAQSNLIELRETLSRLEETTNTTQIAESQTKWQAFSEKLTQLQGHKESFWATPHEKSGLLYNQIADENTLQAKRPPWGGGQLTTLRNFVVAEWQILQRQIQTTEAQKKQITPNIQVGRKMDDLHQQIVQAEQHLLQIQTQTGLNLNELQVYHPMFHQLSDLTRNYISPAIFVSVLGIAAILLLLNSISIFSEGAILAPNVPNPNASPEPNNKKTSWFNNVLERILPPKSSGLPTQVDAPIKAMDGDKAIERQLSDSEPEPEPSYGFKFVPDADFDKPTITHIPSNQLSSKRDDTIWLLEQGYAVADIAQNLGISKSTVYRYRKQNNA